MELLYWIIAIVIVVVSIVFILLVHSGLLYTPVIRMSHPASMPRRVAYVLKQGPYKNCGAECNKIMKLSRGATTFGLFYDDPEKVAQDKTRYIMGCCLPDEEGSELEESLVLKGYKVFQFPVCEKAVITEFPDRNIISTLLSIWSIYPELKKFFKKHNLYDKIGPIFEVYEKGLTRFYVPLQDNEKYFVPGVTFSTEYHGKKDD